jgi:hypothetical protein
VAFATFLSIRRRRAAAGGCVSCQLRCQHAMTEQPRRLLVVSSTEHGPVAARSGATAAQGGPVAPRWPDRPAYRSGTPGRPGGHAERRERAGSAALADPVLPGPHRGIRRLQVPVRPQSHRSLRCLGSVLPVLNCTLAR